VRHLPPWRHRRSFFIWSRLGSKVLLVCFYQRGWHLRMSISFLKASLEHCCSPSPTTLAGALTAIHLFPMSLSTSVVPSCRQLLVKFLTMAVYAYVGSTTMVCPAALDLVGVVTSGCFAVVVVGRLFDICFAAESVMAAPLPCGCFVVGGVFSLNGCLAICGTLADALPPPALWPPLW
jgi:hypothetical protein